MRKLLPVFLLSCALLLPACQHVGKAGGAKGDAGVAGAIASAAEDAASGGMMRESLVFHEKLYHSDPRNPDYILSYARGLRRVGRIDDARLVIRTPANGSRATEEILTEAALVFISAGQYDEALEFAQKAVEKDGKSAAAHHALALALSGLEKYPAAQLQFQQALKIWPENRDKTPVINNLAMALAAQGKIAEARTVMAMATGEALRSRTYQNNRAMLDILEDRAVAAEPLPEQGREENADAGADRPAAAASQKMAPIRKMKPIIE